MTAMAGTRGHKTLPRHRGPTVPVGAAEWNGKAKQLESSLLSRDALEADLAQAFAIDLEFLDQMGLVFGMEYQRDGYWLRITEEDVRHIFSRAGQGDARVRIVILEALS